MLTQRSFLSCAQVRPVFCFPDAAAIYSSVLLLACPYPPWSAQCLYLKRAVLCSSSDHSFFLSNLHSESQAQELPRSTFHLLAHHTSMHLRLDLESYNLGMGLYCSLGCDEGFFPSLGWNWAVFFRSYSRWTGNVAQLGVVLSSMHKTLGFIPSTT